MWAENDRLTDAVVVDDTFRTDAEITQAPIDVTRPSAVHVLF